ADHRSRGVLHLWTDARTGAVHPGADAAASALAYRKTVFRSLKPYQIVVDVVVAGLFAVIVVPLEIQYTDPMGVAFSVLSAVIMTLLLASALAVRRLSPAIALGIAWLAAIAQMSFG